MPRIKDQAVCIWLTDWSETSQVAVFLTETHGKLRGLAKGSKRSSPGAVARYSGGIELLGRGQVVGITRGGEGLATVTEWDLRNPHHHLRTDLTAHRLGLYAADIAGHLLADEDPHPRVFSALADFLPVLARPAERAYALLAYQWALLEEVGYRPDLDTDARTGKPLPATATGLVFDPRAGGVIAGGSGFTGDMTTAGPWPVRAETVGLLRAVREGEPLVDVEPGELAGANRLLCVYIRSVLDRELVTMRYVLS